MLTLQDRATFYNKTFPTFAKQAPLFATERWLLGVWMIGNDYRSKKKYYGEYPPKYLERIRSLFPDIDTELHLFSGSIEGNNEKIITFDMKKQVKTEDGSIIIPNIIGNAEQLSKYFPSNSQMLIIADPPYSDEDATHYGTPLVNRNKVVKECYSVLKKDGFLVWLDQVYPMYSSKYLKLIGTISVIRSTNHRVRVVFIYQKISEDEWITTKKREKTSKLNI